MNYSIATVVVMVFKLVIATERVEVIARLKPFMAELKLKSLVVVAELKLMVVGLEPVVVAMPGPLVVVTVILASDFSSITIVTFTEHTSIASMDSFISFGFVALLTE